MADLYVPQAGRVGSNDNHVLPDELGLDANRAGIPWTPRDLIAQGREKALAAGASAPDARTCIRYGLIAAAHRNPIDPRTISTAEALGLVRLALFDVGPASEAPDVSQTEMVEERVLAAIERYLHLSTEAFKRLFIRTPDNLVRAISKQMGGGGQLPRALVRQAILNLVFRSYEYVGDCIHKQMAAFAMALPDALTQNEFHQFASLYRKQNYLGGLPLVLLYDRFEVMREVLVEGWSNVTSQ